MAAAQHKLSRRALLAGACAGAALPFSRHPGLDPGSIFPSPPSLRRWTPDQVRGDGKWFKALERFAHAESALVAVAHSEDDDVYGRALGRHHRALARLLRAPAPDLAAVARKLDLIVRHSAFELSLAEPCLAWLRQDVGQLAAAPPPPSAVPLPEKSREGI